MPVKGGAPDAEPDGFVVVETARRKIALGASCRPFRAREIEQGCGEVDEIYPVGGIRLGVDARSGHDEGNVH